MAWRIDKALIRGFIDNREKGTVSGELWFAGCDHPVVLELEGNPWRDLAGYRVAFVHENPEPDNIEKFSSYQNGVVGDITASRKVKIPELPIEEFYMKSKMGIEVPFHWANSLYLEWYSDANGRVVLESADYIISLEDGPTWIMTEEEEYEQCMKNQEAAVNFVNRLTESLKNNQRNLDKEEPSA